DPEFRLKCMVELGNEDAAFKTALTENAFRNELSDMEHALNHEEARRRGLFTTDAEIAAFYGRNASWVSRIKSLLTLPTDIQRKVHAGDISTSAAVQLAQLPASKQKEAVSAGKVQAAEVQEA